MHDAKGENSAPVASGDQSWPSPVRLAAVVEAAYILDAVRR